MNFFSVVVVVVVAALSIAMFSEGKSDDYVRERDRIMQNEKAMFIGGQLKLTEKEKEANEIILRVKKLELEKGYENISTFLPAQHFFNAREKIKESEMFSIIKKIPKGGSLHTHFLAGVSADFIIENITYRENIYGCDLNGTFKMHFFENGNEDTTCAWKKLEDYRKDDQNFDKWLRQQLTLEVDDPHQAYPTANDVWIKFKKTFSTQFDMVCFRPIFETYIYQVLKEIYLDNIMYTELRGTFMKLYELNGTTYTNKEFMEIFVKIVDKFKADHPNFVGVRYIHSIYRGATPHDLTANLQELLELKTIFPDFIAGFDLVGFEEEGHTLFDFHQILLEYSKHFKFYFHAGETNWFGHTDENLLDAILLNTSRIGHGFGLNKHPALVQLVKDKNICVELCPISNQVLMLIRDPRNHPMVNLMANGFPVVVCNDDPSAWEATGLSFDWYVAFMAMTSKDDGITVLKQFATNSILYSAMDNTEKATVLRKWEQSWQAFLDHIISLYKKS